MWTRPFLLEEDVLANIRHLLKTAVMKRMKAGRQIGCLLSGGLDSSIITALVVQCAKELAFKYPIKTFSIGMDDSPDLVAARKVGAK